MESALNSPDSGSLDARWHIAHECVRLRVTGEELRARSRRSRVYSGDVLARLHGAEELIVETLDQLGSLMAAPVTTHVEADWILSEEIYRISIEVQGLAQKLVERSRELVARASALVQKAESELVAIQASPIVPGADSSTSIRGARQAGNGTVRLPRAATDGLTA